MLSLQGILTLILRVMAVKSAAELSLENWFCGHNLIIRILSYSSMIGPCWKYAAQVNHCCALHDNCYDLQLGRSKCDHNFCDCLKRATAPDTCAATEFKCFVIKNGGEPAYSNAATYKEPPTFIKIVPDIEGIKKDFELLYEECPQVMLSIKSCSLIANICLENNEENCEKNLTECVQQAADLQDTQECWRAISQAQLSLEDSKSNRQRVRRDVMTEGTTTTIGVMWDSTTKPPSTHPTSREHLGSRDPFTFNFFVCSSMEESLSNTENMKASLFRDERGIFHFCYFPSLRVDPSRQPLLELTGFNMMT